jgi:hypothetical protein
MAVSLIQDVQRRSDIESRFVRAKNLLYCTCVVLKFCIGVEGFRVGHKEHSKHTHTHTHKQTNKQTNKQKQTPWPLVRK